MVKERSGMVDLVRFIASLLIMARHLCYLGLERGGYRFWETWIFVELFFILAGYYAITHFEKTIQTVTWDTKSRRAISYTIRKWGGYFPYIIIALSIDYLILYIQEHYNVSYLINYVFDVTLLTGSFKEKQLQIGSLWFVSALLISFPLFCIVCQIYSKHVVYIISFYVVLFYYGYYDSFCFCLFPHHILRTYAGLSLGIIVYAISKKIRKKNFSMMQRIAMTVLEITSLLFTVVCSYYNKLNERFFLLCFIVGLSIMLSGKSFTTCVKGLICEWLGKISLPMYIFHMVIIDIINCFTPKISMMGKFVFYYMGTFVVGVIVYYCVEKVKRYKTV